MRDGILPSLDFNSTKVQLKEKNSHKQDDKHENFNSTKVQLKGI